MRISKAISKKKEDLEGVRCCPRNPPPITNRYTIRPYEGSVKCLGGSQRSVVLMKNISDPYGKNFAPLLTKRPLCDTMPSKITRIQPIYIRYQSYYIRIQRVSKGSDRFHKVSELFHKVSTHLHKK